MKIHLKINILPSYRYRTRFIDVLQRYTFYKEQSGFMAFKTFFMPTTKNTLMIKWESN